MGPGEETGELRERRQADRAALVPLIAISVVASLIGIAIGLAIDWFPTPASTQADPIDTLWDVLIIASVPVFVGVTAAVLYCVWRFRMRPGQELQDGPPIHGNTRLEVIWTVIPAVIILGLCAYSYFVLQDIEEAQANEMEVKVVGQQFTWTFEYGEGEQAVRSNQLYLPEDRSVKFLIQSRDVLHDFWVPDFRMKIDAVPGITTDYRVTPNRQGRFEIVCAELCGIGHAYMRQTANVVTQERFDQWLQERRRDRQGGGENASPEEAAESGSAEAASDPQAGARGVPDGQPIFEANGCSGCHQIAEGAEGGAGPNLLESLAGKDEKYILDGIVAPNKEIAEGFGPNIMPQDYGQRLSQSEIDALVKYLDEVSK